VVRTLGWMPSLRSRSSASAASSAFRPAGVAVRVRVGHGAKDLTLDDQHFGAVGGSTRWQGPGYDQASDRYDVAVSGGADTLTVHTG
jgi:hypothetical protein